MFFFCQPHKKEPKPACQQANVNKLRLFISHPPVFDHLPRGRTKSDIFSLEGDARRAEGEYSLSN
jgi:hypothetical protein